MRCEGERSLAPSSLDVALSIVFLDGELYLDRVQALPIVEGLVAAGHLPPTAALFVSFVDPPARHRDFACDPAYAGFVSEDVVGWLAGQGLPAQREQLLLCGLSLSGLGALDAALRCPERYRGVVAQSPSAWWNEEHLRRSLPPRVASPFALWLSVGDQETERDVTHAPSDMYQGVSQLDSCQRLADALRPLLPNLRFGTFEGGHDYTCWRQELAQALRFVAS